MRLAKNRRYKKAKSTKVQRETLDFISEKRIVEASILRGKY